MGDPKVLRQSLPCSEFLYLKCIIPAPQFYGQGKSMSGGGITMQQQTSASEREERGVSLALALVNRGADEIISKDPETRYPSDLTTNPPWDIRWTSFGGTFTCDTYAQDFVEHSE